MATFYAGSFSAVEKDYIDVSKYLFDYEKNLTPFMALLNTIGSAPMKSTRIDWIDKDQIAFTTSTAATATSAATSVTVADSSHIPVKSVIIDVDTGEYMRVTANNTSTNVLTVTRGWSSSTASAVATGETVYVLGTAVEEAGTPNTYELSRTAGYNYIQEFGRDLESSYLVRGMDPDVRVWRGQTRLNASFRDFKTEMERTAFLGLRKDGSSDQLWGMGGIFEFVAAGNIVTPTISSMSIDNLETYIQTSYAASPGSGERWLFAGSDVISRLDSLARGNLRVQPVDTKYGIVAKSWLTSYGPLYIKWEPVFVGDYSKYGVILDPEDLKLREMYSARIIKNVPTSANKYIDRLYAAISLEVRGLNKLVKIAGS